MRQVTNSLHIHCIKRVKLLHTRRILACRYPTHSPEPLGRGVTSSLCPTVVFLAIASRSVICHSCGRQARIHKALGIIYYPAEVQHEAGRIEISPDILMLCAWNRFHRTIWSSLPRPLFFLVVVIRGGGRTLSCGWLAIDGKTGLDLG
jgi:hypothetical protein